MELPFSRYCGWQNGKHSKFAMNKVTMLGIENLRKSSDYRLILAESLLARGGGHRYPLVVRPIAGQGLSPDLLIECNRKMQTPEIYPAGTKFKCWVRDKHTKGKKPHLYCYYGDPIESLSEAEAADFLATLKDT